MERILLKKILSNDLYLGHNKKLLNPMIISYLCGTKKNKTIFKFHEILLSLRTIYMYLRNLIYVSKNRSYKFILFFSNHPVFHDIVKQGAIKGFQPYIVQSWVGGSLSNKLLRLRSSNVQFNYPYDDPQNLSTLPSLLFLSHLKGLSTIFNELMIYNIPIITIVDSDYDPNIVDYPFFGNSNSVYSLYFYVNFLSLILNRLSCFEVMKFNTLIKKSF